MTTRTSTLGAAALVAAGSLLFSAPAFAVPGDEPDLYERDCTHTAGGVPLKLHLTVQFAGPKSDTITKVTVRATDAKETGAYRNAKATVAGVQIYVKGKPGRTLDKSSKKAPYSIVVPSKVGKDAFSATATVYWKLPKKGTAEVKCFYLNSREAMS